MWQTVGRVEEKKIVLGIIDLTYTYHAFQNSKEHCHEQGVLLMVLCSPSNPSLSSDSSESGLAHSWYLYYLENRKSTRSTSVFFQFSHAYIHSFLTLFLRHFLSTKGEDTDYLGTTYLVSGLSNSEKGQQDKYMCDTWEGHQVSVWLILAVSRYTQKKSAGHLYHFSWYPLGSRLC